MSIVIRRPAVSPNYINSEEVRKTVKLVTREKVAVTDVLMMLQAQGVPPDQIVGLSRGAPRDPAFYVYFKEEDMVTLLKSRDKLSYRNVSFTMVALGSQIVTLRIHWLPLYFSDSLIRSILADFGKVITVERSESRGLQSGVRVVHIEVSEEERLALPHLIQFACGTTMLLTMPGRPPLCLRCQGLGHVRRDCPLTKRSFSAVVTAPAPGASQENNLTSQEQNVSQEPQQQPQEQEEPVGQPQQRLDSSTDEVSSHLVIDEDVNNDGDGDGDDDDDGFMEVSRSSLKRNLREESADSFEVLFPPQKVVRGQEVQTSNRFDPLDDLFSESIEQV